MCTLLVMPEVTAEQLRDVVARYGIGVTAVGEISSGRVNRHWRIEAADGGAYVLRRYARERSTSAIAYEQRVIEHAAGRGWPVASPLTAAEGATTVADSGRTYALFPFMRGAPGPARDLGRLRMKGNLLARLHGDLASWPERQQRDGWGRVWEHDISSPIGEHSSFNDALLAFGREHPALAAKIRTARYRSVRELARLGYGALSDQLVHFDFHNENLFFDGDELTALLDFDSVHLDARVADIACSIANDCAEPPADIATSPAAAAAFVDGYVRHTALDDVELRLIAPLLRGYRLAGLSRTLTAWAAGRADQVFARLHRLLDERLPALDANGPQIEAAIMRAVNHGPQR